MKHAFLVLLLLITQHIAAMDQAPVKTNRASQTNNNNAALDEIITNIDAKINEKYLRSSFLEQLSITVKSHKDYCNIIATPKQIYPTVAFNEKLLDKLSAKNSIFAQAVDYFVKLARTNFENVTPITLNTVNNPEALQPIPDFNGIDQSIKKYILLRASNQIDHACTIKIASGAPVIDFDICPATDTIAISTGENKHSCRLRLWDLKTADPLYTFEEENPVHYVCFNTPGNQLATLVAIADKRKIKIWNPLSKQLLHIIEPDCENPPYALVYNDHPTNHLLHACYYIYTQTSEAKVTTETWITNTEHCLSCGSSELEIYADTKMGVEKKPYRAFKSEWDSEVNKILIRTGFKALALDVTKSNCTNLYLCLQATKKAQHTQSLTLVTSSNPFKTATRYEQNMITQSLEAKRKQLTS